MNPFALPKSKHVYRLGVYGVKGSGKTCILSALALSRVPHPRDFSCSWIEQVPEHPLPTDNDAREQSMHPLHVGWRYLVEQKEQLRTGSIPEPTKLQPPMAFRFEFGSPLRGRRHVELIDYAGELVEVSTSTFAAKLRNHLNECDGLLILAETPAPQNDQAPFADALKMLQDAFSQLRSEKGGGSRDALPVAILFNKWDRRGNAAPTENTADLVVQQFLDQTPPPAHASLVSAIRNAVGKENLRCFPVSAFGRHKMLADGREVPELANGQLQSFGLEDGFVWTLARADELEVACIEIATEKLTAGKFLQLMWGCDPGDSQPSQPWLEWFRGVSAYRTWARAGNLNRRLIQGDSLKQRVQSQVLVAGKRFASQLLAGFCAITMLFLFGVLAWDVYKFREATSAKTNLASTDEDLRNAVQWLNGYHASWAIIHPLMRVGLSPQEALTIREEIQRLREQRSWAKVEGSEDKLSVAFAKQYLKDFPEGSKAAAAWIIVRGDEFKGAESDNLVWLEKIVLAVDVVDGTQTTDINDLESLFEKVAAVPMPEAATEKVLALQHDVRRRIVEKRKQVFDKIAAEKWELFRGNYNALMQTGKISQAADLLQRRLPKDQQWRVLKEDFSTRAVTLIVAKVNEEIGRYGWQRARECAALAADPNVIELLEPAQIKGLAGLKETVASREDAHMYGQIVRNKPDCRNQIEAYLARAPLQRMQDQVRAYLTYLDSLEGPLDLTLNLKSVNWGQGYRGGVFYGSYEKSDVTVSLDGQVVLQSQSQPSVENTDLHDVASEAMPARRLDKPVSVVVEIKGHWGLLKTELTDGGRAEWSGPLKQLNGKPLSVNGNGWRNTVTLTLDGIPSEPRLPPWGE
jgi:hypothetical protein